MDTYYKYDDKDRLAMVVPPDTDNSLTETELLYEYTYDGADNILSKKIPGQALMTYLYDDRDLMTYMQDGNMADQPKWLHTRYEDYGRPTQTGFVTTQPTDGNSLQTFTEELTETFYDGNGLNLGTIPDIYKGKVSRSESRILGESDWLYTNNYYDSYGRILQNINNHHLDPQAVAADETNFEYDFADNLVRSTRIHRLNGATTTIEEEMHYDHAGRLLPSASRIK